MDSGVDGWMKIRMDRRMNGDMVALVSTNRRKCEIRPTNGDYKNELFMDVFELVKCLVRFKAHSWLNGCNFGGWMSE